MLIELQIPSSHEDPKTPLSAIPSTKEGLIDWSQVCELTSFSRICFYKLCMKTTVVLHPLYCNMFERLKKYSWVLLSVRVKVLTYIMPWVVRDLWASISEIGKGMICRTFLGSLLSSQCLDSSMGRLMPRLCAMYVHFNQSSNQTSWCAFSHSFAEHFLDMLQVYTFGPTFRAENSNTTRHLAEFWVYQPFHY
jgi:hypothetical protein